MFKWIIVGGLGIFVPRLMLFLGWALGMFDRVPWGCCFFPLLGFVFVPYTTLAFGVAHAWGHGISFFWLLVLIVAFLADIGTFEGTRRHVKTLR